MEPIKRERLSYITSPVTTPALEEQRHEAKPGHGYQKVAQLRACRVLCLIHIVRGSL